MSMSRCSALKPENHCFNCQNQDLSLLRICCSNQANLPPGPLTNRKAGGARGVFGMQPGCLTDPEIWEGEKTK